VSPNPYICLYLALYHGSIAYFHLLRCFSFQFYSYSAPLEYKAVQAYTAQYTYTNTVFPSKLHFYCAPTLVQGCTSIHSSVQVHLYKHLLVQYSRTIRFSCLCLLLYTLPTVVYCTVQYLLTPSLLVQLVPTAHGIRHTQAVSNLLCCWLTESTFLP
jgi:hypothetical protein